MSNTELVIIAAAIGAGGSVIGGIVGGWLTMVATRRQWKRDRADARVDRSRQAAQSIADAIATMEGAIVTWAAGESDPPTLRQAFNTFSRGILVESITLVDSELRQRVRTHVDLVSSLAALAHHPLTKRLVPAVRHHTDAMVDAIEAHCAGEPLPAYQRPPLGDAAALVAWVPGPSDGPGPAEHTPAPVP